MFLAELPAAKRILGHNGYDADRSRDELRGCGLRIASQHVIAVAADHGIAAGADIDGIGTAARPDPSCTQADPERPDGAGRCGSASTTPGRNLEEHGEPVTICLNGKPMIACMPAKPLRPFPFGAWDSLLGGAATPFAVRLRCSTTRAYLSRRCSRPALSGRARRTPSVATERRAASGRPARSRRGVGFDHGTRGAPRLARRDTSDRALVASAPEPALPIVSKDDTQDGGL